jgi:hypothetical protein
MSTYRDAMGENDEAELYAAFEALGGQLTWDELARLLDSGRYPAALGRLAALLLDDDSVLADRVVRDSVAALRHAAENGDRAFTSQEAHAWLCRAVVNRARSVRRDRTPRGDLAGFRALPARQREAVVLYSLMGLPEQEAAAAMGISTGAVRSHLTHGMRALHS